MSDDHPFRSRLEAAWAQFFSFSGIRFDFDPEGYEAWRPSFSIPAYGAATYEEGVSRKVHDPQRLILAEVRDISKPDDRLFKRTAGLLKRTGLRQGIVLGRGPLPSKTNRWLSLMGWQIESSGHYREVHGLVHSSISGTFRPELPSTFFDDIQEEALHERSQDHLALYETLRCVGAAGIGVQRITLYTMGYSAEDLIYHEDMNVSFIRDGSCDIIKSVWEEALASSHYESKTG